MKIIICALLLMVSSFAHSDSLGANSPVCESPESLHKFVQDRYSIPSLRPIGCFTFAKAGRIISVIESNEYMAKIRVGNLYLFTPIENVVQDNLEAKPYGYDRFVISSPLTAAEINASTRQPKTKSASDAIKDMQ